MQPVQATGSRQPAVRECKRQPAAGSREARVGTPLYNRRVPIGSAFHERTAPLAESLSFRDWAGYYAVSAYETHHDHEYNAIRNACALIDISPLFKYRVRGPGATRLVNRVITRDAARLPVGQIWYTPWCDDEGMVDRRWDGDAAWPRMRIAGRRRTRTFAGWWRTRTAWTSRSRTSPSRWPHWPCRDRPRARSFRWCAPRRSTALKYFRATRTEIAGVPVDVSRTGYTGDLGYEIWMPWDRALAVWDALAGAGSAFDLHAAGMLALDVARVEAGLLLIDVDFHSSRKALIEAQKYTPAELGLARLVDLRKPAFIGRRALVDEQRRGHRRQIVGLELEWTAVEALYEAVGLPPAVAAQTSRVAVPVYSGRTQIGRATSTTWSTTLKKMIALATLDRPYFAMGSRVEMEVTVEAVRHRAPARVVPTPFFNPPRKTA